MGAFAAKQVILIPFPFSDLSNTKLRPAVVLASLNKDDYILCQITSKSYADPLAIELKQTDFKSGSLNLISYARPGKLFTANEKLILKSAGTLNDAAFDNVRNSIIQILQNA